MEFEVIEVGSKPENPFTLDNRFKILKVKNAFDAEYVKDVALKYEPEILKLPVTPTVGNTKIANTTTGRHKRYNVLEYPELHFMKEVFYKSMLEFCSVYETEFSPTALSVWFNILRQDQTVGSHNHMFSKDKVETWFAGNTAVDANDTYTVFEDKYTKEKYYLENKNGELYMFPAWAQHWSEGNKGLRITMAFDCSPNPQIYMTDRKYVMIGE